MGGGTPPMFAQLGSAVDRAWQDAGRPGKPRKLALAYFALGPEAQEETASTIRFYYGEMAERILPGVAVSAEMIRGYVAGFERNGCDELILAPARRGWTRSRCSPRRSRKHRGRTRFRGNACGMHVVAKR